MADKPAAGTPLNTSHALASGLEAAWLFQEGSGTSVADSSANSHTITLPDAGRWITGVHGEAYNTDGLSSSYLTASHDSDFDWPAPSSSSLSIFAVVNTNVQDLSRQPIVSKYDSTTDLWHFVLEGTSNAPAPLSSFVLRLRHEKNPLTHQWVIDTTQTDVLNGFGEADKIVQLGVRMNTTAPSFFVNGTKYGATQEAGTGGGGGTTTTGQLTLGTSQWFSAEEIRGSIESVMMWNRGLSDAEFAILASDPWAMYRASSGGVRARGRGFRGRGGG